MWSYDIKCKYMFIFPLKISARKESINIHSPLNVNRHLHMHVEYYPVPYAGGVCLLCCWSYFESITHVFYLPICFGTGTGVHVMVAFCCCLNIIQVINNPLTPPVTNNYSCIFIPELSFAMRSHYIIIIPGPLCFYILTMALSPT